MRRSCKEVVCKKPQIVACKDVADLSRWQYRIINLFVSGVTLHGLRLALLVGERRLISTLQICLSLSFV